AYPGLGLPERYRGYFFLCDYRYLSRLSGVWSFALEPAGAGFELVDEHVFLGSTLATDLAFGYDGRIFVSVFDQIGSTQHLLSLEHERGRADPRVAETARLVREGLKERSEPELADLLRHADRRVRQRAQWELVGRGAGAVLARVAGDPQAPLLQRLHAIWGLGQLGAEGLRSAGWEDLDWLAGEVEELRAQVARVAGEAGAVWLEPGLIVLLRDPGARVRFFAAQSLGRLRAGGALPELVDLLRENADADPFLRHSAVYALFRLARFDALLAHADDPAVAVRRGVLLALRYAGDPRIRRFLRDSDPSLVAEAARAIYDGPIPEAFGELAELAGSDLPEALRGPDSQTSGALQRRAIGAALALGRPGDALRLAAHAADASNPIGMRRLALEALADFPSPPSRDLAMGFHRPLPERDPAPVRSALERHGAALIRGELGARALEVATDYDRLPFSDAELAEMLEDDSLDPRRRVAALRALDSRGTAGPFVEPALASRHASLRSEAREMLARTRPTAAVEALRAIPQSAPLSERQHGIRLLGGISDPGAERLLADYIGDLGSGRLDPGLTLDVIEAARAHGGASVAAALADWEAGLPPNDPVERRIYALAGGEPERGREVFEGAGDCLRCHGGGGHGGGAGPPLEGVFERRGGRHLLRSLLEPWAEIAPDFASVSVTLHDGEFLSGTLVSESDVELVLEVDGRNRRVPVAEIASRAEPTSGMPATGLTLAPDELRDLVAYVASL
ncbi:MAG: c-type cytochrome, partial [Proteobacteria bacterium]|nr:c-type cytochrome [Pseudomonadota bacterium]